MSGSSKTYTFKLRGNTHPFKVTLAYSDYQSSSGSSSVLVNNLDLKVYQGSSTTALAVNNLNAGVTDTLNNLEQVLVKYPAVGVTYTVEVYATTIVKQQPFALVVTGNFYKTSELYPGYTPTVNTAIYQGSTVTFQGSNFGSDKSVVQVNFTCNDSSNSITSTVTSVTPSALVVQISSSVCQTISAYVFVNTFYTSVSSILKSSSAPSQLPTPAPTNPTFSPTFAPTIPTIPPTAAPTTPATASSPPTLAPTLAPTTADSSSSSSNFLGSGLSKTTAIGVGVGVIVAVLLLLIFIYCVCCTYDKHEDGIDSSTQMSRIHTQQARVSGIPPGFHRVRDALSGQVYYVNPDTGETALPSGSY